jgi:hypothetical protein
MGKRFAEHETLLARHPARPGHELPTFYEGLHLVRQDAERTVRVRLVEGRPPVPCLSDGLNRFGRLREELALTLSAKAVHAVKETIAARGVAVVAAAVLEDEARKVLCCTAFQALYPVPKRHHALPRSSPHPETPASLGRIGLRSL